MVYRGEKVRRSKEEGAWQWLNHRGEVVERDRHPSTLAYIHLAGDSTDPLSVY